MVRTAAAFCLLWGLWTEVMGRGVMRVKTPTKAKVIATAAFWYRSVLALASKTVYASKAALLQLRSLVLGGQDLVELFGSWVQSDS